MQATWETADGRVRLYQGDALSVLASMSSDTVDAVVTDPPYEGMKGGTAIRGSGGVAARSVDSFTVGAELGNASALSECERVARKGAIAFCSFHWIERCAVLLGGQRKGLVSWYKRNSPYSTNNSPWFVTEYAWAVQYGPGIDWRWLRTHIDAPLLQAGCFATERVVEGGKAVHPAQKPIVVMQSVLLPGMDEVCDPYMGLGTTGIACIRTGRRFIGIEKEPKYFDIAVKRISAELERFSLFEPPPQVVTTPTALFGGEG